MPVNAERLKRVLDHKLVKNRHLEEEIARLRDELAAKRESVRELRDAWTRYQNALVAEKAKTTKLREALEPFAAIWDADETYRIGGLYTLRVKYGDIRRARAVLKEKGGGE